MGNLKFHIDDTCVKCGACAVDCPVQCITKGETRFNIGKGCIGCGDCYSICPVGDPRHAGIPRPGYWRGGSGTGCAADDPPSCG